MIAPAESRFFPIYGNYVAVTHPSQDVEVRARQRFHRVDRVHGHLCRRAIRFIASMTNTARVDRLQANLDSAIAQLRKVGAMWSACSHSMRKTPRPARSEHRDLGPRAGRRRRISHSGRTRRGKTRPRVHPCNCTDLRIGRRARRCRRPGRNRRAVAADNRQAGRPHVHRVPHDRARLPERQRP